MILKKYCLCSNPPLFDVFRVCNNCAIVSRSNFPCLYSNNSNNKSAAPLLIMGLPHFFRQTGQIWGVLRLNIWISSFEDYNIWRQHWFAIFHPKVWRSEYCQYLKLRNILLCAVRPYYSLYIRFLLSWAGMALSQTPMSFHQTKMWPNSVAP